MKEGSKVPRRGNVPKRDVLPDPLYNSKLVTKLVNSIMLDGKKGVAQKVVYGAFDIVREKSGRDPLEVFQEAMNAARPSACAGLPSTPAHAMRRPCASASRGKSLTRSTISAAP